MASVIATGGRTVAVDPDLQIVSLIVPWVTAGFVAPGEQCSSGIGCPATEPRWQVPGGGIGNAPPLCGAPMLLGPTTAVGVMGGAAVVVLASGAVVVAAWFVQLVVTQAVTMDTSTALSNTPNRAGVRRSIPPQAAPTLNPMRATTTPGTARFTSGSVLASIARNAPIAAGSDHPTVRRRGPRRCGGGVFILVATHPAPPRRPGRLFRNQQT